MTHLIKVNTLVTTWKYIFFKFIFIYLFWAVLGLRFCARALSSCSEQGPLFIAVRGPLTVVASLVVEHRLQTRRLSNCGSRAQLLRGMWDLPRSGLEPVSPALAGRLPTTAPPGKPLKIHFKKWHCQPDGVSTHIAGSWRNTLYKVSLLCWGHLPAGVGHLPYSLTKDGSGQCTWPHPKVEVPVQGQWWCLGQQFSVWSASVLRSNCPGSLPLMSPSW